MEAESSYNAKSRVIPLRPLRGGVIFFFSKLKMLFVNAKMVQVGDHAQLIPCTPAETQDGNRALTPQVVLEAQLGSVSPTLLIEGVRALKWADIIL